MSTIPPPINQVHPLYLPVELQLRDFYTARACEIAPNAQDGGVVTALFRYALEKGKIKAAVVVDKKDDWSPFPVIVMDADELDKYAGSKYFLLNYSKHKDLVKEAIETYGNIGIVVTPCQFKNLIERSGINPEDIYLKIGLPCHASFRKQEFWRNVGVDSSEVEKFKVDGKIRLLDKYGNEIYSKPIKEIKEKYLTNMCKKCPTFIHEGTDLSVGAKPKEERCIVYAQTQRGHDFLCGAYIEGYLTLEESSKEAKRLFETGIAQKIKEN